ncbi:MAG TPA: hypothetical protein DC019_01160 [Ruminococcus sp.]|nr:hypothetical protein [Ruminococcus sp.]
MILIQKFRQFDIAFLIFLQDSDRLLKSQNGVLFAKGSEKQIPAERQTCRNKNKSVYNVEVLNGKAI